MALGTSNPAANTNTSVYTCPVDKVAYINIIVTNSGTLDALCKIGISPTGTPGAAHWIEPNAVLLANGGYLEHNARKVDAGEQVVVNVTNANCSVRVEGFEEAA